MEVRTSSQMGDWTATDYSYRQVVLERITEYPRVYVCLMLHHGRSGAR